MHGDLSAYNILAAGPRLVIIDLPQVVDLVGNVNGMDYLLRDCANICGWFRGKGLDGRRAGAVRRADGARVLTALVRAREDEDQAGRSRSVGAHPRGARGARRVSKPRRPRVGACASSAGGPSGSARSPRLRRSTAATPPSIRTGTRSTPRPSCTTRGRTPTPSTPAPTPGRGSRRRRRRPLAQALHDHAIDEALTTWVTGATPGRRDGRARPGPASARVRRRRAAGLDARPAPRRRHRRRAGCDGGRQPRRVPRRHFSRDDLASTVASLARGAVVPPVGRPVGGQGARRSSTASRGATTSLGIPTWFYGHEPPNVFATAIAKYFRNATREAILLQVCDAGIVFLPGAGGTVQEIFQDACENYYADAGVGAADGAGRRGVLDRDAARLAPAAVALPAAGRWRVTSTWSTPSTRRRTCSA